MGGTAKFFGVDEETEDSSKQVWNERRMRLATKRFGGVKEDYQVRDMNKKKKHNNNKKHCLTSPFSLPFLFSVR